MACIQVRCASSDVIKETEALSLRTQSANTKRLAERLHDINYWKSELQREIADIISETGSLNYRERSRTSSRRLIYFVSRNCVLRTLFAPLRYHYTSLPTTCIVVRDARASTSSRMRSNSTCSRYDVVDSTAIAYSDIPAR